MAGKRDKMRILSEILIIIKNNSQGSGDSVFRCFGGQLAGVNVNCVGCRIRCEFVEKCGVELHSAGGAKRGVAESGRGVGSPDIHRQRLGCRACGPQSFPETEDDHDCRVSPRPIRATWCHSGLAGMTQKGAK